MKNKIFNELLKHYSTKMSYAVLSGSRTPSLQVIISIKNSLRIPVEAWLDIKSYLQENDTKQTPKQSNTKAQK